MSERKSLRTVLSDASTPISGMGVYDPIGAKVAEDVGFEVVYLGGYAAAAAHLGMPDVSLITQTEMASVVGRISDATRLAVMADADTGFGAQLNVERTVQMYERAGATALHIEDQVFPKRCGHAAGKEVVSREEMTAKLRSAGEARADSEFMIIARTDALAVNGVDDAIERCTSYATEGGADALFVDAPETMDHIARIGAELGGLGVPLVFNAARTGKTPFLSNREAGELGFALVIYPIDALLAAYRAMRNVMETIRTEGTADSLGFGPPEFEEFSDLLGMYEAMGRA